MATRNTRTSVAAERMASHYFTAYYALGVGRSLESLRKSARSLGLPGPVPSLSTLKLWSVKYEWQRRIGDLDARVIAESQSATVRAVAQMNEQQAAVGAMGVQLAAFTLERLLRQLRQPETCDKCGLAPLELDAGDAARLMEVFAKWQRLGMGEATDRREIAITIWNVIVMEIMQLFLAVNSYGDEDRRKREYALGVDDIVTRHLAAAGE